MLRSIFAAPLMSTIKVAIARQSFTPILALKLKTKW
jgi:hypothetical protein